MNKGELITFISQQFNTTKVVAEQAIDLFTGSVIKGLGEGHNINLVGFGSFETQKRKAREGRNPKTGEKMQINEYMQPVFRAGKVMKDACNKK